MSPTVFRTRNLRIVIFFHDHMPPHVHVFGPESEAKFDIETLECLASTGFSERSVARIKSYLEERKDKLLEVWDEFQK